MQISIRASGLKLREADRALIRHELESALDGPGGDIARVNVFVADANGDKGGIDKTCRVVVHRHRQASLVIEDSDADLAALVRRVADRAGHAAGRQRERRRSRKSNTSMSGE